MEDLEPAAGSPVLDNGNEPQGNHDAGDTLRPDVEEEDHTGTPPMADPVADMETRGDDGAPAVDAEADADVDMNADAAAQQDDDDDDLESDLEELDEQQFEDFDASALNIPDKPLQVDESNVGLLGVHKRKRTAEEEAERERKKKKKANRREKPKRSKRGEDEDDFEGGVEMDGKRVRKSKGGEGRAGKSGGVRRARTPEDESMLSPEERRRRALDRKMDEALKSHRISRRKATQDMEERADQELASMRERIGKACEADAIARASGGVATQKLKILPQLVELLNRNTIQTQIVDPDVNILEGVRWMLEPADQDAALPNYQIQRELFSILARLNIGREALKASQLGKVVLFYTKSIQPQPAIKQIAQRLVAEWMRIILNKNKNRKHMHVETRTYDPIAAAHSQRTAGASQVDREALAAEKRRKVLAAPAPTNRARPEGGVGMYTIAPVNNMSNGMGVSSRTLGSSGSDAFKRIAARSTGAKKR